MIGSKWDFVIFSLFWFSTVQSESGTCQSIDFNQVNFCTGVGYTQTRFPNRFADSQESIRNKLENFQPLSVTECHEDLKRFLCLFYMPYCSERYPKTLLPCRELCLSVQKDCMKYVGLIYKYNGLNWPAELDCNQLPEIGKDPSNIKCAGYDMALSTEISSDRTCSKYPVQCPAELRMLESDGPSKYNFLGIENCGPPCKNHFWTKDDIELSRKWILGWGVLCLISTLFTVCTYLIDRERFRYPERPIVFLAACYLIVSVVYITGYFMEFDVSCTKNLQQTNQNYEFYSKEPTYIVVMGTKIQACTVLFMILYFSTMASSIWWLVLCVNWFLAAVLKWSGEAIENQSQYFHLAAWALPAISTVSVLALGRIEGDPLSGICFVGQYDTQSLQIFLLWPQLVFLCVGFLFLIVGFLSMYRIRAVIKTKHPSEGQHQGLEKLMLKIGIFSSLYLIPASILLGCYFYTYMYNEIWNKTWLIENCDYKDESKYGFRCSCDYIDELERVGKRKPNFTFFMLRYFMMLIVGVTCGFWIWSDKTFSSWRKFFRCPKRSTNDPLSVPLRSSRMEPAYPSQPVGPTSRSMPPYGAVPRQQPESYATRPAPPPEQQRFYNQW